MIQKDRAFVIRRYNFRETSLIVNLYSLRFGKIKGILKGFYTQKKEFSSPLENFSLNEFVFYPKKSEIWLVSHVDLIFDYPYLRKSLSKARAGGLLFNLLDRTAQLWDKNAYIFELIESSLAALNDEEESKVVYTFLIKFLTFSGFKPEFNHCIKCQETLFSPIYFSASKGGLICPGCQGRAKDIRRINPQVSQSILYIQKEDFPLVYRLNIDSRCQEEIFYILGQFLSYHFDFHQALEPDTDLVSI